MRRQVAHELDDRNLVKFVADRTGDHLGRESRWMSEGQTIGTIELFGERLLTIQTSGQTRKAKNSRMNQVFGQVKLPIQTSVRYFGRNWIRLVVSFGSEFCFQFSCQLSLVDFCVSLRIGILYLFSLPFARRVVRPHFCVRFRSARREIPHFGGRTP